MSAVTYLEPLPVHGVVGRWQQSVHLELVELAEGVAEHGRHVPGGEDNVLVRVSHPQHVAHAIYARNVHDKDALAVGT